LLTEQRAAAYSSASHVTYSVYSLAMATYWSKRRLWDIPCLIELSR